MKDLSLNLLRVRSAVIAADAAARRGEISLVHAYLEIAVVALDELDKIEERLSEES